MSESPLRQTIEAAAVECKLPMKDLTVLAVANDPFRVDTPARHRDGEWLAVHAERLGLANRTIHLRGLHYALLGVPKPNGTNYTNTDDDWTWLQEKAADAARWLGYIPFDRIVDQRNTPPTVRVFAPPVPRAYISVGLDVQIPDAEDIEPYVGAHGFTGVQPYKLVLFGEKSSLEPVLGPMAEQYAADLYLPTGEVSDTLIFQMARNGAADGRPMVILYFADCDPAGWQMSISIARKLQAFRVLLFPDLEFQVHRVALTPDQVREYGLPSTPLKDTEKRGDRWREAMGTEQTEIDALASLRPELLRNLAHEAIGPFYDASLSTRVWTAYSTWREEAQSIVDSAMDWNQRAQLVENAEAKLAELRAEIDAINAAASVDADRFDLPPIVVPAAELSGDSNRVPLIDSQWSFVEQTRALIESKAYRNGGA